MDDASEGTQPAGQPPPARTTRTRAAGPSSRPKAKGPGRATASSGASGKPAATAPTGPTRAPATGPTVADAGRAPAGGPWRRSGNRALYNRGIQRANEHWPLITRGVAALLRHPRPVLAVLGRSHPVERDGRVLNPAVQAMIELGSRFAGGEAGGEAGDPATARAQLRRGARLAMPVRTDVHVSGRVAVGPVGGAPVPVRVYRRYGSGLRTGPEGGRGRPAIVYFHGGSWVSGDLDSHDASCRLLAAASRCLVVSVGYRLAPEHPFPAAVEDALAAYRWVHDHHEELGIEPGRVAVMGDSAGANLAAVVALETRAGHPGGTGVPPPSAQGLIYPVVDARLATESMRTFAEGFFLSATAMRRARELYLPDPSDWTSPLASPLLAESHQGCAPALVVTAGFDPLRDDGTSYAEALRSAGVDVEYRCYDDQIHGFMGMGILADSLALATEVSDAMGRLVRRSPSTAA